MKRLLAACGAVLLALGGSGGIVTNVTMRQLEPWNGLVAIGYELTEDAVREGRWIVTSVNIEDREHGTNYTARTFTTTATTADRMTAGAHRLVWNAAADGVRCVSSNAVCAVTLTAVVQPPLYCVVDLAGGTNTASYPVSYLAEAPVGGWTDEYKTSKLVLRYIEPGTFTMGDQVHGGTTYPNITISKPFWIGVFEVTQRQWELVMGTRPSYFSNDSYYLSRPVERVSYDMIRGSSAGSQWPSSSAVDSTSFLGQIRAKTGLNGFDLPTEAQWEYAARSGTTTDYGNGTSYSNYSSDSNMSQVGRYYYNGGSSYSSSSSTSGGTAKAGSYAPNKWGLYDMHGNVWEWCRDWSGLLTSGATDPVGASSGSYRVLRGGSWFNFAYYCTSSSRGGNGPGYCYGNCGFRLFCSVGSSDQ